MESAVAIVSVMRVAVKAVMTRIPEEAPMMESTREREMFSFVDHCFGMFCVHLMGVLSLSLHECTEEEQA